MLNQKTTLFHHTGAKAAVEKVIELGYERASLTVSQQRWLCVLPGDCVALCLTKSYWYYILI